MLQEHSYAYFVEQVQQCAHALPFCLSDIRPLNSVLWQ